MGRIFLEHLGGTRLFSCAACDTFLTNRGELISTRFTGATGRAFLFNKVVNLIFSEVQDRVMLTGRHMVRDVSCKNCETKLGWIYEFALEDSQRYKEGKVILERALVTESDGFEERPSPGDGHGHGSHGPYGGGHVAHHDHGHHHPQPPMPFHLAIASLAHQHHHHH